MFLAADVSEETLENFRKETKDFSFDSGSLKKVFLVKP